MQVLEILFQQEIMLQKQEKLKTEELNLKLVNNKIIFISKNPDFIGVFCFLSIALTFTK